MSSLISSQTFNPLKPKIMKNNTMDWNLELNNAIENEPTQTHYEFLCDSASKWVLCAVGTQCNVIPRDKDGQPIDRVLNVWGNWFYLHIIAKKWDKAQSTLKSIEQRSAKLIAKLTV